jgi:hypothetical protein
MIKSKQLMFRPLSKLFEKINEHPVPASSLIPKWYKDLNVHSGGGGNKPLVRDFGTDKTLKSCMPFLDGITAGYLLKLPLDLSVDIDENGIKHLNWITKDYSPISVHDKSQVGEYPIPSGYDKEIFKIHGTWGIQTPPGYSLMYIHPLGRFDLPFYTFHGIVDTDQHYVPINMPFVLKTDFVGVIPRGTPYSQLIPIKREKWESNSMDFEDFDPSVTTSSILLSIEKWYKDRVWQKKEYK